MSKVKFKDVIAISVVLSFAIAVAYQAASPYIYGFDSDSQGALKDIQKMVTLTFEVYSGLLGVIVGHYFYQQNHRTP